MSDFVRRRFRYAVAPSAAAISADGRLVPVGGLGWPPATFWSATLAEFHQAMKGQAGDFAERPTITQADARRIALQHGYTIKGE